MRRVGSFPTACLLALCAIVLAGCSGDSDATTTVTVPATSTGSSATEPSTETTTDTGETETGPQEQPEVLASAESSIDKDPARIEIVSLVRSGSVVQLTLRLHNLRDEDDPGATDMGVSTAFDDSLSKYNGFDNPPDTLDAVYLVDGKNKKKYLVAHDSAGQPLTDTNLNGIFIAAGEFVTLSASLAAPPADVTDVDVFIPKFGTLSGVPIG